MIYFPAHESPSRQEQVLIILWKHPYYCLLVASSLSFDVEYLFLVVSSLFYIFHQFSCDIGVFVRGAMLKSFYSAILSPTPSTIFFNPDSSTLSMPSCSKCFHWVEYLDCCEPRNFFVLCRKFLSLSFLMITVFFFLVQKYLHLAFYERLW